MGCFSNTKKKKNNLFTNENIALIERRENINLEKPILERKNTDIKPKNYSKLGSLRFN